MNLSNAKEILERHYQKQINEVNKLPNNAVDLSWIHMKKRHSFEVYEIGKKILKNSQEIKNFSEKNKIKAEIIFLLHDIGRFYEIGDKKPTNPKLKNSHGILGAEILQKDEGVSDLAILLPIRHHDNIDFVELEKEMDLLNISTEEKNIIYTLSKLIKDADKLANLLDFKDNGIFSFGTRELNYSKEMMEALEAGRLGERKYKITVFDSFISYFSWENDLFFEESKRIIVNEEVNAQLLIQFSDLVNEVASEQSSKICESEIKYFADKLMNCKSEIEKIMKRAKLI
jgi:hypothetical protein